MPKRIQRKRTKGWRMPPNTVYAGRPTKWGNPFKTGNAYDDVATYACCVRQFPVRPSRLRLWKEAGGNPTMLIAIAGRVRSVLDELRGRDLACWCGLDQPCHVDLLLEIANVES